MKEIWKDIKGYEGYYQVSNTGKVKSFHGKNERILSHRINRSGYCQVALSLQNNLKYFVIHRLVALTFIPNPNNKKEVNHKDGNKTNNNIYNLEWATRSENLLHSYDIGLRKIRKHKNLDNYKKNKGYNYWGKKQVIIFDKETAKLFNSIKEASQYIGCSYSGAKSSISNKCRIYGWRLVLA